MKRIVFVLIAASLFFACSCEKKCELRKPTTSVNWNDFNNVHTIIDNTFYCNNDLAGKTIKICGYLYSDTNSFEFKLFDNQNEVDKYALDKHIVIRIRPTLPNSDMIDTIAYNAIISKIDMANINKKCYVTGVLGQNCLISGAISHSHPRYICPDHVGSRGLLLKDAQDIYFN
jgi:hypothetical protein